MSPYPASETIIAKKMAKKTKTQADGSLSDQAGVS